MPKLRKSLVGIVLLALALELLYLLVANTLLNTPWLAQRLSRNAAVFSISWSSGWSLVPGHFRIEELDMRGRTPKQNWRIYTPDADFGLSLLSLPFRSVRLHGLRTDNLDASLWAREDIDSNTQRTSPHSYLTGIDPCLDAGAFRDLARPNERPRWNIVIDDLMVMQSLELTYYDFHLSASGTLQGDDLCLVTRGPVAVRQAGLQLASGALTAGPEPVAQDLAVGGEIRIAPLVLAHNPKAKAARFVSGELDVAGDMASYAFINRYLDAQWLRLDGRGQLNGGIRLRHGVLTEGTALAIDSPDLAVDMDEVRLLGTGAQYRVRGAGSVSAEVLAVDNAPQTQLGVTLRDMEMRRFPDDAVFAQGEDFTLAATAPPIDLSVIPPLPSVSLAWQSATMPDVALLNAYLPHQLPLSLTAGEARVTAELDYANGQASGRLVLDGEHIAGFVLDEAVTGGLHATLALEEADLRERRLDLTGTRIEMQASPADAPKDHHPLQTWIGIQASDLRYELPPTADQPLSISGSATLAGGMANIDFLNRFIDSPHGLAFHGDGRFTADLQVNDGHLVSGSRIEVESSRLTSGFLDFEATGAGRITATLPDGQPQESGVTALAMRSVLSGVALHRQGQSTPYITSGRLDVDTQATYANHQDKLLRQTTRIKLANAELPDISVYNGYLPKDAGLSLLSGRGALSADLRLRDLNAEGDIALTTPAARIRVRDQTLRGDLALSTRLKHGHLRTRAFDIAGTRLSIDNAALEPPTDPHDHSWWGRLDLEQGKVYWREPLKMDARAAVALRDSGLFVHLFFGEKTRDNKWLDKLLRREQVTGHSLVALDDRAIRLTDARLDSGKLRLEANLMLDKGHRRGGLFAAYESLDVGVEIDGEERDWKILNTNKWWKDYARRFREGNR